MADKSGSEPKFEMKSTATVRDILKGKEGQRVILLPESGSEIEGTVSTAGDELVHLAKLSGKDYYDAVVRIDRIVAVQFKVRG